MKHQIRNLWQGQEYYRYLLWALAGLLIIYPLMADWIIGRLIEQLGTFSVLVTGILAIYKTRRQIVYAVMIAVITLFLGIAHSMFSGVSWLNLVWLTSALIFFVSVTWVLARDIFISRGSATSALLYGAVSVYLLIGLTFANVHFLLETITPGSYHCQSTQCDADYQMSAYVYFSFVTLTTMGYGDITPATRIAGMLSYMEAITGQMYVAILMARLVGMHISQSEK